MDYRQGSGNLSFFSLAIDFCFSVLNFKIFSVMSTEGKRPASTRPVEKSFNSIRSNIRRVAGKVLHVPPVRGGLKENGEQGRGILVLMIPRVRGSGGNEDDDCAAGGMGRSTEKA